MFDKFKLCLRARPGRIMSTHTRARNEFNNVLQQGEWPIYINSKQDA